MSRSKKGGLPGGLLFCFTRFDSGRNINGRRYKHSKEIARDACPTSAGSHAEV